MTCISLTYTYVCIDMIHDQDDEDDTTALKETNYELLYVRKQDRGVWSLETVKDWSLRS